MRRESLLRLLIENLAVSHAELFYLLYLIGLWVGWLVDWLVGWWVGWVGAWLVGGWVGGLITWLV